MVGGGGGDGGGGKYGIKNGEYDLAVESEGELEAVEMGLWGQQCGLVVGPVGASGCYC